MSLETCLFASKVHSLQNSRQLNAMSIKSLLSKRCWLFSLVKITMNALMRESLRWESINSLSSGPMSLMLTFSISSVSSSSVYAGDWGFELLVGDLWDYSMMNSFVELRDIRGFLCLLVDFEREDSSFDCFYFFEIVEGISFLAFIIDVLWSA